LDPDPYPASHVYSDPDPAPVPNRIGIHSDLVSFQIILKVSAFNFVKMIFLGLKQSFVVADLSNKSCHMQIAHAG